MRTVRTECLDWMLIIGHRHLERVLRKYVGHYNRQRPHQASASRYERVRRPLLPRSTIMLIVMMCSAASFEYYPVVA